MHNQQKWTTVKPYKAARVSLCFPMKIYHQRTAITLIRYSLHISLHMPSCKSVLSWHAINSQHSWQGNLGLYNAAVDFSNEKKERELFKTTCVCLRVANRSSTGRGVQENTSLPHKAKSRRLAHPPPSLRALRAREQTAPLSVVVLFWNVLDKPRKPEVKRQGAGL